MSKNIKWDHATGPAENAASKLPKAAEAYFTEVRKILAEDPKPEDLHPARLASKHFRYSLEIFRPCYAEGLEERIDRLKGIQDLLGDCNDAVVAARFTGKTKKLSAAVRTRVTKHLKQLAAEKALAFRKKWNEEFDAEGQEEWWTGYLARNAHPPSNARPSKGK